MKFTENSRIILPVTVLLITILVLTATTCNAQGNLMVPEAQGTSRTITVTGSADVMVIPDEAVFSLSVETENMDITKAKAENDTIIKKIKNIAHEFKIDSKYVVTDFLNVNPKYTYNNSGESIFRGYTVQRGLVITLKELGKFDEMLTRLLDAGAHNIQRVQFKTTQLRKFKDEARTLAIRAAKEKASAMAKEVGQTIGKANMIQEIQEDTYSFYGPWSSYYPGANWSGGPLSNSVSNAQTPGTQNESYEDFSPGQIKVSAKVSVIYDLN